MIATPGAPIVAELAAAGVRRVSLGSTLYRAAMGAFLRAARELRDDGTFAFLDDAGSGTELSSYMS